MAFDTTDKGKSEHDKHDKTQVKQKETKTTAPVDAEKAADRTHENVGVVDPDKLGVLEDEHGTRTVVPVEDDKAKKPKIAKNHTVTLTVDLVFTSEFDSAAACADFEHYVNDDSTTTHGRGKLLKEYIDTHQDGFLAIRNVKRH